jgi:hypothetical protein
MGRYTVEPAERENGCFQRSLERALERKGWSRR